MPRPTSAQYAYGSATVVCATLAMLLLSGTQSGAGVVVIAVAALALGLLAVIVPVKRTASRAAATTAGAPQAALQRGACGAGSKVSAVSLRR